MEADVCLTDDLDECWIGRTVEGGDVHLGAFEDFFDSCWAVVGGFGISGDHDGD